MRQLKLLVCIVCLIAVLSSASWSVWLVGEVHAHDEHSDGVQKAWEVKSLAKKAGCDFLIMTNHYEQINDLLRSKVGGFEGQKKAFEDDSLLVFVGAEISSKWGQNPLGQKNTSHTLVLDDITDDAKILDISNNKSQQDLLNYLGDQYGYLTVAAHPHLYHKVWKWEPASYPYDKSQAEGMSGVEFFNDATEEDSKQTFDWYLSLKGVFPSSGCDTHLLTDIQRRTRKTYVDAETKSKKAILKAFREGKVYAAQNGCTLENFNYQISFEVQNVERPKFSFDVCFSPTNALPKTIQIYRDGALDKDSVQTMSVNSKRFTYDWSDQNAEKGQHTYVIEVKDCLITAPITLNVSLLPAEKTISYTGGVPILIGKTRSEVVKMWGDTRSVFDDRYQMVNYDNRNNPNIISKRWQYSNVKSVVPFTVDIHFVPFFGGPNYDPGKEHIYDTVQWVQFLDGSGSWHTKRTSPRKLVPAEILNQKPAEICRMGYTNSLLIIWYINGNTFALAVRDSQKKLFDAILVDKVYNQYKYRLNGNSLGFRDADIAFYFWQLKGIPQLFGEKVESEMETFQEIPFKDRGRLPGMSGYFYRFID